MMFCKGTSPSRQSGLSLVELMIALVLGLVLTGGVIQIFTSSGQAYRMTDSLSQLQENLRFSLGRLQYDARRAGYKGCLIGNPMNHLDLSKTTDDYAFNNRPVIGWEAAGSGIGNAYTISGSKSVSLGNGTNDALHSELDSVLPGSDVVVINTSVPADIVLSGNPHGDGATLVTSKKNGISKGRVIIAVNGTCTGGDMFQNSSAASSSNLVKSNSGSISPGNLNPAANPFSQSYTDDASVYVYSSNAYFIAAGSSGEPSLFVRDLSDADSSAIELVEGVENMQVLYGINDSDKGSSANRYVTASDLKIDATTGVNDWNNVVSVRLALLLRSEDNIEVDSGNGPYNLLGTQITTATDRRARMAGVVTVGIRNRLN